MCATVPFIPVVSTRPLMFLSPVTMIDLMPDA
jgi:hypothetical protein